MIKRARYFSVVFAALLPLAVLSLAHGTSGCKSNETDDAQPTATASVPSPTPTPTPTPTPAVMVPEQDAGSDAADAGDASDAKAVGGGGAAASIAKCCTALQQNASSAPPEQKAAYLSAATACQGLRNTPAAQQAFAQIRAFLAGAKMPGACQ
jgi:hypothetical protein